MEIKVDDISLVQRVQPAATSPLKEVRAVSRVNVEGRRSIIELSVPGSTSGVLQDMGRDAIRIRLSGDVWGPDARKTMEALKAKADGGAVVSFTSDLAAATEVASVVVDSITYEQSAANPTRYSYSMVLVESKAGGEAEEGQASLMGRGGKEKRVPAKAKIPPPPPPKPTPLAKPKAQKGTPAPDQKKKAQEEVKKESEIHDIRVRVLDSSGRPVKDAEIVIKGPDGERKSKTDEEGYILMKDVKEGSYQITSKEERFRNVKQDVTVKKGKKT
jgi:hypothetical protein